ncbi:MAG: hypothetical protein ACKO6N_23935 [Myxococcota bacterium]
MPRLSHLSPLLAITLSLMTACGGEPDPTPPPYSTPTPSAEQGNPFTQTGTWAGKYVISQFVENVLSFLDPDDFVQQYIVTYSIVKLSPGPEANTLYYAEDNCITVMTEVNGAKSELGEGYFLNSPLDEYVINLSSDEVGATFTLPETLTTKGVNLEDPVNDPLPTDPKDPRLLDFDQDGNPGYTVYISGAANGELYATERYIFSYIGTVVTDDLISGLIDGVVENTFVESTNALIPTDTQTKADEDPSHNFFEFKRVEDGMKCEQLLEQYPQIFPE